MFSNQCAAHGFNIFSKSGPLCKKLAHPCSKRSGGMLPRKIQTKLTEWKKETMHDLNSLVKFKCSIV